MDFLFLNIISLVLLTLRTVFIVGFQFHLLWRLRLRDDAEWLIEKSCWYLCSMIGLTLSVAQGSWLSQLFYIAACLLLNLYSAKNAISVSHLFKKFYLRERERWISKSFIECGWERGNSVTSWRTRQIQSFVEHLILKFIV